MSFPASRPAVWFVTGTSRGLGLDWSSSCSIAVTASPRRPGRPSGCSPRSATRPTSRAFSLTVDLRDEAEVAWAVQEATERLGGLDVVVNNAGYGFLAAVEETGDREVRDMLDVQVVGVWNVLRAALPVLRERRGGHIVNVSSILGLTAVPGWALYCAGKFALEGLSEALAAEVADFGIGVTIVEPGYFRTEFLTEDSLALPAETTAHYPGIREMVRDHLKLQGGQLGDPVKGARAIIDRVVTGKGPLRLLLGSDAHSYATVKVEALRANVEAAALTAPATDFPAA